MVKQLSIAVLMDPIETINPLKDSTLALLLAAQDLGMRCYYCLPGTWGYDKGLVKAQVAPISVKDDKQDWFDLGPIVTNDLARFDVVLIRNEPPFDNNYLYLTQLLQIVQRKGVNIINSPQSLQSTNEKLALLQVPQYAPEFIVSSQKNDLEQFIDEQEQVIIKPLDGMGGQGIFYLRVGDTNRHSALEMLTAGFKQPIMAQTYIPTIEKGDKRLFLLNGEVFPYSLIRLPRQGEARANMAAGGTVDYAPLTEYELKMATDIAQYFTPMGLSLIGLDVIGHYVTEINVTCPTGMRELTQLTGINVAQFFWLQF